MNIFFGIHWAGIDKIIYFPLFLILITAIIYNFIRVRNAIKLISGHAVRTQIFQNFSFIKHTIKMICMTSGLIFLFLAFLQPQWSKKEQEVVQEGRDLLIVLDISRSMLAQDFKPSRLEFAKLKIRNLLSMLSFERVGLILFSGTSFVQCPLTIDHPAFLTMLDHVDTEVISSGTTALDTALTQAINVYKESSGTHNKGVLLITDGEDFSTNLDYVKQQAQEQNIRVFALGVGSPEGAPIPKFDFKGNSLGHETLDDGTIALSKLNERLLTDICTQLNGHYFTARYDDYDLNKLTGVIKQLEKEKFSERKISQYEERYPYFLGIAWILFLLEWIL